MSKPPIATPPQEVEELKPCWLCGSNNLGADGDGEFMTVIWCKQCGVTMDDTSSHADKRPVIDRWNTPIPPPPKERGEGLEELANRLLDEAASGRHGPMPAHDRGQAIRAILAALQPPAGLRDAVLDGLRVENESLRQRLAAKDMLVGDGFVESLHAALDEGGAPRKSDDGKIIFGLLERIRALASSPSPSARSETS